MGNPAPPDAERDMCISLRGSPDTKSALGRDTRLMPQVAAGTTVGPRPPDSSMPGPGLQAVAGERPPCFDAQCGHRGGLVRTKLVPPSLGGRLSLPFLGMSA